MLKKREFGIERYYLNVCLQKVIDEKLINNYNIVFRILLLLFTQSLLCLIFHISKLSLQDYR